MLGLVVIRELVAVLAVAALAVYLLRNARLPSIVGLLVAGVLIGPGVFGLVSDRAAVEVLAEVGVIFLLFTIGLRFSIRELVHLRALVFGAGALQLCGTAVLAGAAAGLAGVPPKPAALLGLLVGMSSTAIVLRLLEERGEIVAPHGRLMVGVLIFQDIAVVPIILCLPLLGAGQEASWLEALGTVGLSVGLLVVILGAAHFALPWLLDRVVNSRSRELFTLTTVLVALGTAWLCSLAGASLPLGAFLAGVILSESRYAQQILSDVLPLRDVFASLFFVSVGMLVTPAAWAEAPWFMSGLLLAVVVGKAVVVAAIARLFGFGGRVAVLAGLGLAQIGEFSFIVARAGGEYGLLSAGHEQAFFAVAVISMMLSPFTALMAHGLVGRAERTSWLARYLGRAGTRDRAEPPDARAAGLEGHVVLVGFGVGGQSVARVLRPLQVPYHILELNPHTVRLMRAAGERIHYGDATRPDVLEYARVQAAKAVVVTIADPAATRQIVAAARRASPDVRILVRTRFVREVDELHRLGATAVVTEEFEGGLELAGLVMETYGAGPGAVEREKAAIRKDHYALLRHAPEPRAGTHTLGELLASTELDRGRVEAGSEAEGRALADLDLRKRTGATILAVTRAGARIANPGGSLALAADDVLTLFGEAPQIEAARRLLRAPDAG